MKVAADSARIEVDGRSIAYRMVGAGPPLVLLHGGWEDSRSWRLQLESLADEYTVIAWDAPGCGRSDDPPEGVRLGYYADTLAGLIRGLGLEHPHVLGLSFGGGLAIELYHRHPGVPRSLILVGAYAGWAGSLPADVVDERVRRIREETQRPPAEWAESYLPTFFATPIPREWIDEMLAIMSDSRPSGMVAILSAFAEADLRDVLPTIAVPTLILNGELDERAPLRIAEGLHANIPGSQLVVIPGVGHCCNLEAPKAFDAVVRHFLRQHRISK
ncbi:alpha/beta hydrolase [Nocardia vinacea]|uniref:alpha/beta fold hydrolase n=1 Tax=Nocardia vinacea TaxID=96468 RepID=UPI00341D508F